MELEINIIDAFTNKAFKGNSAAVIITDKWLPVDLMQSIAVENNLSETAFVKKIGIQHFEIRWFSPITEIDFCGHATLAASFAFPLCVYVLLALQNGKPYRKPGMFDMYWLL